MRERERERERALAFGLSVDNIKVGWGSHFFQFVRKKPNISSQVEPVAEVAGAFDESQSPAIAHFHFDCFFISFLDSIHTMSSDTECGKIFHSQKKVLAFDTPFIH